MNGCQWGYCTRSCYFLLFRDRGEGEFRNDLQFFVRIFYKEKPLEITGGVNGFVIFLLFGGSKFHFRSGIRRGCSFGCFPYLGREKFQTSQKSFLKRKSQFL